MAHKIFRGRQAAATTTGPAIVSSSEQPTTRIALSTTFTPPKSCMQNHLTILPPPGYLIWLNEPVPFEGTTYTDCYPSEFLQSYTSVSSGMVGSSVVPLMSPLVCPQNFCVQFAVDNYMACCPSGYEFAVPKNTVIASRPAYGGTCYSAFSVGATTTVTSYDSDGSTRLQLWTAETSAQAYAHPIDGFAESKASVGCIAVASLGSLLTNSAPKSSETISSSAIEASSIAVTPTEPATLLTHSNGTSKGTIAGAVIGALAGLAIVLGLILFLLRKRRQHQARTSEIHHIGDDVAGNRFEKEGGIAVAETDAGVAATELTARSDKYAYELTAEVAHELPANR